MQRVKPMLVLLCASNPVLTDRVTRELTRHQYRVRHVSLGPLDAASVRPGEAFDVVIADLDVAETDVWLHAASLRATFPYVPLILLSNAEPSAVELDQLHPCAYIRKPLATEELEAALDHVGFAPVVVSSPPGAASAARGIARC